MGVAYVYSACDIVYSSFYLEGLQQIFGWSNVRFSFKKFPAFRQGTLAIIIVEKKQVIKKIVIDFHDRDDYNLQSLEWCDIYGKINVNKLSLPALHQQKIVPIGPGFATRVMGVFTFAAMALINYQKSKTVLVDKKGHFSNYLSQYKHRLPLSFYTHQPSDKNYLFFLSTIWKGQPETNSIRRRFIEVAKGLKNTTFEGGFAPRVLNDVPGFEDITVSKRYPFRNYLNNIKKSFTVFNTKVVLDCHGWKLGEFLILGKAIISTPLSREMPGPITHGREMHLIDGSEEAMLEALIKIKNDDAYRTSLEENARKYFLDYVEPVKMFKRFLSK